MGTIKGKVKAPNKGVRATIFFSNNLLIQNHSVSALSFSFVSSRGVTLSKFIVILFSCSPEASSALSFPLIVPITISKFGINYGILSALVISSLWFIAMLRTSEMPH